MAIVPLTETVKNTIEVFNDIYKTSGLDGQWMTFIKFFGKISFDTILYLLSCQWINDFVQLPITLPQMAESIFTEMPDTQLSFESFESFESSKNFLGASFFSGFFNCFFLYFPLSPIHFIWLRYVLLDGQEFPWAGKAATLGLIAGNVSLFGVCLFGWRSMINIWFGLEPLTYFFGVWLILKVIFELTHHRSIIQTRYQNQQLWKIFFIHFGGVWADQSGFYQFFGNLSVQSGFSVLDFSHSSLILYFIGIGLGSLFWTFFIGQMFLQIGYLFPRITPYTYSFWIRGLHSFCLISCVTLTLTGFAFYGTDYLFTNPIGFLPQDQALEIVSLGTQTKDTGQGRLGEKSSFGSVDTDLSSFDRARYAGGPVVEFHIESLNYQEEYAWRSRIDRFSSRGLNRGGGILDQYITTQLGPVDHSVQKQRKHKKREQQIQKLIKKNFKEKQKKQRKYQQKRKRIGQEAPHISSKGETEILSYKKPLIKFKESSMDYYGQLIERYIDDYAAEANSEDPEIPDLASEKMVRFSAFSELSKYGFDVFSLMDAVELDPFDEELTRDLKEKFSENIINKFLIRFDISNFIQRQPKSYQLTSNEEISLFEKRLALAEYFDTLREYFDLPPIFQPLFCGSKSYANRVYNQQFKGTLKIVERLFSIHLEDEKNIPILPKPDQKEKDNTSSSVQKKKIIRKKKMENDLPNFDYLETEYLKLKREQKEKSVLKFDQPLYKTHYLQQNPLIHEQLTNQMSSVIYETDVQPFLQEGDSYPFFVGWDNEQRKFVITNRLLTRETTLTKISLPKDLNYRLWSSPKQKNNSFTFTTWPVTEKDLQNSSSFHRFFSTYEEMSSSAEDVFKYAEPQMEEDTIIYQQLPHIVRRIGLELKDQPYLAPKRGGFIWPGNEPLKYKFQLNNLIKKLFKNLGGKQI